MIHGMAVLCLRYILGRYDNLSKEEQDLCDKLVADIENLNKRVSFSPYIVKPPHPGFSEKNE